MFLSELQALNLGTARPILRAQSTRRLLGKAGSASSEGPSEANGEEDAEVGKLGSGRDSGTSPGPGKVHPLYVSGVVCTWEAIADGSLQVTSQHGPFGDFKVSLRYNSKSSLK